MSDGVNQAGALQEEENEIETTSLEISDNISDQPTIFEVGSFDQCSDESNENVQEQTTEQQCEVTEPLIAPPMENITRSFSLDTEPETELSYNEDMGQMSYSNIYYRKPQPMKYDFTDLNQLGSMNGMSGINGMSNFPQPMETDQQNNYYVLNDENNGWGNPMGDQIPSFSNPTPIPPPEYLMNNTTDDDYFYPIVCGNRTTIPPPITAHYFPENYITPRTLALGYPPYGGQAFVVPYTNYTTLQPQNFYACMQLPPISRCQTECIPGRMPCIPTTISCEPSTQKTPKPTQPTKPPSPIIAWENNSSCCCDVQTPIGPTPFFAHCRPPYNMGSFYCRPPTRCPRRNRREYYLQAPKARTRVIKDMERCKPTTTTTPRPKTWPTNYPIKFRLQKSIDESAMGAEHVNQVNNLPPVSAAAVDQTNKIIMFGTDKGNEKPQRTRNHPRINKSVAETAASKLRKKHNEIKMQELQETLEIALEKMNQEMNE